MAIACRVAGYWLTTLQSGGILLNLGHVSVRIPGKRLFLVPGRRKSGDLLLTTSAADVITADFDGRLVEGSRGVIPPAEAKIHSWLYKTRDDVAAVCHLHPHYSVLSGVLGLEPKPMCNEGIDMFPVRIFPNNALITTDALGKGVAEAMKGATMCILRGHGIVTTGETPEIAVWRAMLLEEQARLNVLARMASGEGYPGIPQDQVKEFVDHINELVRLAKKTGEPLPRQLFHNELWLHFVRQSEKYRRQAA